MNLKIWKATVSNQLAPGPRLMKKRVNRSAVSQTLRNTGVEQHTLWR